MEHSQGNALARLTATFEGNAITAIEYNGQAMMMAQEVGRALGFSDASRFTSALAEYSLVEGKHFVKLVGPELAAFKAALPDAVNARTPNLVLLTETGLYRALMRSRAPRAEDFQEWIASEVLPQLRRTGRYEAPAAAPAVTKAAVLVELHASGTIPDRALISHLDDDDLATLPAEVTVGMLRRLSGAAEPLPPLAGEPKPTTRRSGARVVDEVQPSPIDALRAVMLWAKENEASIATWGGFGGAGAVIVPPGGGRWLGRKECAAGWRWISLDRREVVKVLLRLGLSEMETLRAWSDLGFLISDKGGYLACTTSIPGTAERVRMLRFTRQAVERAGSILLEAAHASK